MAGPGGELSAQPYRVMYERTLVEAGREGPETEAATDATDVPPTPRVAVSARRISRPTMAEVSDRFVVTPPPSSRPAARHQTGQAGG